MKKNIKENIFFEPLQNFAGLKYLTLKNCPKYMDDEFGKIVALTDKEINILAAVQIITRNIPLRGLEVAIIRKALGLSYEKFARPLNLSAATVLKWEKSRDEFISLPNDALVRLFASDQLKCNKKYTYKDLAERAVPEKAIEF